MDHPIKGGKNMSFAIISMVILGMTGVLTGIRMLLIKEGREN